MKLDVFPVYVDGGDESMTVTSQHSLIDSGYIEGKATPSGPMQGDLMT